MSRQKDVQYRQPAAGQIERQRQMHRLRHIIAELAAHCPKTGRRARRLLKILRLRHAHACRRLLAPALAGEDHTKDIDFSPAASRRAGRAGYARHFARADRRALDRRFDPMEGFILHEARAGLN